MTSERRICGAEPQGLNSGALHNRVCWLNQGHEGDHRNRTGEEWALEAPRRSVVTGGGFVANRARRANAR